MTAAQYWYETPPGANTFDISEHLQQSFWRYGLGTAWFKATRAQPPYTAEARWGDVTFNVEWVPQRYVIVRLPGDEAAIENAFTMVLGFKPVFRYRDNSQTVVEWRQSERAARWNELVEKGVPDLKRV